jgi:hypothetical protein
MKMRVGWILIVLLLVLCSCDSEPLVSTSPFVSPVSPIEPPVSPAALSATEEQEIACMPASSSSAAIYGTLQLLSPWGEPSKGSLIYLAQYVGLDSDNPIVVLDSAKDINTVADDSGFFCFNDVPPATYGLIVWNAVESYMVSNSDNDYSLMIEALAGEPIDLGVLFTPFP